ncbi:hypothetical protein [Halomarina ordinaria]|uniref:DUF2238 domain-containing protein n=1 Tax=Halomarina ordinaria TaxID=3033939 RepID=A0ABD5U928_9EURY|nr:hypothetical protein [Halomarina sp. PSRA2]
MALSTVLDDDRTNAATAWALVAGLTLAAAVSLGFGEPLWSVLALAGVAVAVVPAVAYRDASAMPPWEVLAVVAVPALLLAVGAPAAVTQAASYLALAALALLVVVELHVFSSVELTPRVAVALVVLLTMAATGVWTVVRYAVATLLGTGFVGKVALMWDITLATAVGVLAGGLAWAYLASHESAGTAGFGVDDHAVAGGEDGTNGSDDEGVAEDDGDPDTDDDGDDRRGLMLAVRAMQVALVGVTLFALVTFRWGLVINAGIPLAVTFLPGALERDVGLPMNAGLTAWITLAVFLHAVGALGPYQWFGWYDSVTHALSASVVAGAGYASARALDLHYDRLTVPPEFMFAFVVVFVLAFGVVWEVLEFASGGLSSLVGGEAVLAQYGARDIVLDLTFNTVGGVLVALFGTSRLRGVAGALASSLGGRSAGRS